MSAAEFSIEGRHQTLEALASLDELTYRLRKPQICKAFGMTPFDVDQAVRAIRGENGAMADAEQRAQTEHKPLFVSVADLLQRPPAQNWLIRDYLEMDSTALLFGESTAGKSFVAIDMACSIASGQDWSGHKVRQGAVFYVAGEGHAGFSKRFLAWQLKNGIDLRTAPIFLSTEPVCLPDDEALQRLTDWIDASGHAPRLIIFDTLARSLLGDENSSKDVGDFIRSIDRIRSKYGCCVLVVHHTGHSATDRARGSSALKAAMDTEICLSVQDDIRTLSVSKQKNHEPVMPKAFSLESIALPWADDEGNPMYSAAMVEAEGVEPVTKRDKRRLSRQEDAVLNALSLAVDDEGEPPTAAIKTRFGGFDGVMGQNRKVAHLDRWREKAYPILDTDGDKTSNAKKKAFQRIRRRLQDLGLIQTMDDFWWIIRSSDIRDNRVGSGQGGSDDPAWPTPSRVGSGHTPIGVTRMTRLRAIDPVPYDQLPAAVPLFDDDANIIGAQP